MLKKTRKERKMNQTWDVTINGITYHLVLIRDKKPAISINQEAPILLSKLKKKTHVSEVEYFITLGAQTVVLHMIGGKNTQAVLTMNNRDCVTGAEYEVAKASPWAWAFVALYILNFFFIVGGAIGGAIAGGCGFLSMAISADKNKSTLAKVMTCLIVYVIVTVISIGLAFLAAQIMRSVY